MSAKGLSIKANILWNSFGSMTYLGCQWLVTVFVVRLSSSYDAAGMLSLAMSVVGIFGTFANYKMGTYQISDINHENTLGQYLAFRLVMLVVAFLACVVYALFTCPLGALGTIALFYGFKAVGLVIDIFHGADQQNRRMDYIGKSFILQGVSTLLAFIVVFGFTQNLDLAIIAMTVTALCVLFFYDVRKTTQFEKPRLNLSKEKAFFFLRTSLPAVIASLAASAIFTIPKQYLSIVSGDAALGVYSSVAAIALVIQMGATYLYVPVLDIFPKLFFNGYINGFAKLRIKTTLAIIIVAVACAVILEFIGAWVLAFLFGDSIIPYVYLLQPVLLATVMTAFLWFLGDVLVALRDFKANLIGNLLAFIIVLPASLICVNIWDMNGVSFAGTVACACGVIALFAFIYRDIIRQRSRASGTGAAQLKEGE